MSHHVRLNVYVYKVIHASVHTCIPKHQPKHVHAHAYGHMFCVAQYLNSRSEALNRTQTLRIFLAHMDLCMKRPGVHVHVTCTPSFIGMRPRKILCVFSWVRIQQCKKGFESNDIYIYIYIYIYTHIYVHTYIYPST
jgi:hypothetical protein